MQYINLKSNDLKEASSLIWDVFSEYVAPGYSSEGIETFRKFIQTEELAKSLDSGRFFILGCFDKEKLVGLVAVMDLYHISLLFVDKLYHRRGIARELLVNAVHRCVEGNPKLAELTVNSSPYAVEIYKKLGFEVTGEQTIKNGITFTPMNMVMPAAKTDGLVRYMRKNELKKLLDLYTHLNKDDPGLEINEKLAALWENILNDPSQHYLVVEADGRMVSSCVLLIVNNLTRGARPYGLIENVVTHKDYRNKGYGTMLLKRAVRIAREKGCYKVMLMSGRGEEVLRFYEKVGFERGKKTGFIIRFD